MTSLLRPFCLITTRTDADAVWLRLTGELDWDTADELVAAVETQLAGRPGARRLHLNCAQLRFCDTMGLSALLTIRRRTSEAGVELRLDELSPPLHRLLDTTGTLEHLTTPAPGGTRSRPIPS